MQTPAAERMRRMRARRKAQPSGPILYQRADWQLFLDPQTLPQKAGCEPNQIGRVIIKELVDNALDSGASEVTLSGDARHCTVADNGPGLAPKNMLRVFAVNRPLLSSKLKRLPTRGMLGNGLRVIMGAVPAFDGTISVTTRGHTYHLGADHVTGKTSVISSEPAADRDGLSVTVTFPRDLFIDADFALARWTIGLAKFGIRYTGPSQPLWYSSDALRDLLAAAPKGTKLSDVIADVFGISGTEPEPTLAWTATFRAQHASATRFAKGEIGDIGEDAIGGYYHKVAASLQGNDYTLIPFCVEAWVTARHVEKTEDTSFAFHPLLNRSPCLAWITGYADSTGLRLHGCGLDIKVKGPKRADYDIDLSLITPYVHLTGDGKAPYLGHFRDAIEEAVRIAAGRAYRNLVRPEAAMSVRDAAYAVMEEAYLKVSDNDGGTRLPAKARQIMYAARGKILELTRREKFDDKYFTQHLLPDYLQDHPEETALWDVVYDARGHLTEPHTGRSVPLGTVPVREYLGQRPNKPQRPRLHANGLYPTSGPQNRFRNVLFVEKEGFDELFEAVGLAERYDLAIMSTKGMSVVAARQLLDELAENVDKILVLHDFDVSGFSIAGTLGTDSRRYTFERDLSDVIVDIGLRLEDVISYSLESEVVDVPNREARRETLERHGATDDEIEFLAPEDENKECHRVELNAMTSRDLVDFVEMSLRINGVEKVIPDAEVLVSHARHRLETKLSDALLAQHAEAIAAEAAVTELPSDLADKVAKVLKDEPELSWDQALAKLI